MYDVYVSGGSNIDPEQHLVSALTSLLDEPDVTLQSVSPVYRTRPVQVEPGAREFHNLCVHLTTTLVPDRLKQRLCDVEDREGRQRSSPSGELYPSRVIDLDILLYRPAPPGFQPHPQVHREGFVVYPLSDLLSPADWEGLPATVPAWRGECDSEDILGIVEYDWPGPLRKFLEDPRPGPS